MILGPYIQALTVPTVMLLRSHSRAYSNPVPIPVHGSPTGIPFPRELPFPCTPLLVLRLSYVVERWSGIG